VSDDRYYAVCMFGGSHVRHNPGGLLWEVGDHEHDENVIPVIDGITEEDAKDLANRLNRVWRPVEDRRRQRRMRR